MKLVSNMVKQNHIETILENLEKTKNVSGDVVELGCNCGTTSLFIQEYLKLFDNGKLFICYDSFEGLPEISDKDKAGNAPTFKKGDCLSSEEIFRNNFKEQNLECPIVVKTWFKNIDFLPKQVSFAFFDGDFYTSIYESFEKIYPLLQPGAIVCIHDYNYLPGVKKACDAYLKDKPEFGKIIDIDCVGVMTKL